MLTHCLSTEHPIFFFLYKSCAGCEEGVEHPLLWGLFDGFVVWRSGVFLWNKPLTCCIEQVKVLKEG